MVAEESDILGLANRSATQGNNARFLRFGRFTDDPFELFMLDAAEFRLAHAAENVGNGEAGKVRDALIEIDVRPAELAGQQPRGGRFAAAHESREADKPARTILLDHSFCFCGFRDHWV